MAFTKWFLAIHVACYSWIRQIHGYNEFLAVFSYMCLVSTCSAAISAACHRPDEDFESHLSSLRWDSVERSYLCFTGPRELSYPALGPGTELEVLT